MVSDDVYKIIKEEKKAAVMVTHDVAEAVSIADKVIVLSKRPAIIKKVYSIDMKDKIIPSKNRHNKDFHMYHDAIWKDFDDNE